MLSYTEENHLKAIYKLLESGDRKVSTTSIASLVETAPASVTDMLKKLADKKLILYTRYQGVSLTTSGKKAAVSTIRKHRLWELFLVQKLGFRWDEVHDIAEELEHINSESLVRKLDDFLGNPRFDPHGDPIPDENGIFHSLKAIPLSAANEKDTGTITGVIDHRPVFLQYLAQQGFELGKVITVRKRLAVDQSLNIRMAGSKKIIYMSHDVAKNILIAIDQEEKQISR